MALYFIDENAVAEKPRAAVVSAVFLRKSLLFIKIAIFSRPLDYGSNNNNRFFNVYLLHIPIFMRPVWMN